MSTEKIDAYLASKDDFAKPILVKLRSLVLKAHPDITEDWKWGAPAFCLNGKIVAMMWGFKAHASLVYYRGAEINDWAGAFDNDCDNKHSRTLKFRKGGKIDQKAVLDYLRQACALTEKAPAAKKKLATRMAIKVVVPPALAKALKSNAKARKFFDGLAPGYRRGFCNWIIEAKREETRDRRVAKAIEALAAGKKTAFC